MARTLVVRAAGAAILGALVCLVALERAGEVNTFALADADGLTGKDAIVAALIHTCNE